MKKLIITENQLYILKEMAYPISFNMEEFKSLNSFSKRVKYCNERLKFLGQGSSRRVYQIDNNKCLKLAKNEKGIAQNLAEQDGYLQSLECFAKTFDDDKNGLWNEMELARKAKVGDFKRITGLGWDVMKAWIEKVSLLYRNRKSFYDISKYEKIFNSEKFQEMVYEDNTIWGQIERYMTDYTLESYGDLQRLSSWGIVNRNGHDVLVLIDYGLNDSVGKEYYGFNF